MPRGDRTGPRGMGPMTGRRAGYCADYRCLAMPMQGLESARERASATADAAGAIASTPPASQAGHVMMRRGAFRPTRPA